MLREEIQEALDLFDEFKDRTNKFYPKKSEINKNFKALELQIRQLYDYIMKKDENTENWLLAKKPIGGFSCASCESYLGDLKENNEKILWNQLPERDILTTNTNRIGNGFSRILNLVNVSGDNNSNKKDNNPNSPNSILKPDYGSFKNELFLQRKNTEGDDENNFSDNKKIMNITTLKNDDEHNQQHPLCSRVCPSRREALYYQPQPEQSGGHARRHQPCFINV